MTKFICKLKLCFIALGMPGYCLSEALVRQEIELVAAELANALESSTEVQVSLMEQKAFKSVLDRRNRLYYPSLNLKATRLANTGDVRGEEDSSSIELVQNLYAGGETSAKIKIIELESNRAELVHKKVLGDKFLEVSRAYLTISTLVEQLAAFNQTKAELSELYLAEQERFNEGLSTVLEQDYVLAKLTQVNNKIYQLEDRFLKAKIDLKKIYPNDIFLGKYWLDFNKVSITPELIMSGKLFEDYEINSVLEFQIATIDYELADLRLELQKSSIKPRVDIVANAQKSSGVSNIRNLEDANFAQVGIQLSLGLLDGASNLIDSEKLELLTQAEKIKVLQVKRDFVQESSKALAILELAQRRRAEAEKSLKQAKRLISQRQTIRALKADSLFGLVDALGSRSEATAIWWESQLEEQISLAKLLRFSNRFDHLNDLNLQFFKTVTVNKPSGLDLVGSVGLVKDEPSVSALVGASKPIALGLEPASEPLRLVPSSRLYSFGG